jgi:hypothetical protein
VVLGGCAEQGDFVDAEARDGAPSPTPTGLLRGMPVPDKRFGPECFGHHVIGTISESARDSRYPAGLPQDPNVVLMQYFEEQRRNGAYEAELFQPENFERHDSQLGPADYLRQRGRWIGYRADGTVFAVVELQRTGADLGWALQYDDACAEQSPKDQQDSGPAPDPR